MSMKSKLVFLLMFVLIIPIFIGNSTIAEAKALKMSLAWAGSEEAPYTVGAKKFKELFEKYTNGEVEVKLYCCFKMGGEQEMFKKLQLGTLDGTIINQNNAGPFFPLIDLFVLPYTFQSFDHVLKVVDGPVGKMIGQKMLEESGVHLTSVVDISFRNIYNSKRPINSLEDVAGLRYRVPKNPVMIDTYKAFGADPTPIAWSETLTATQTGIVDGGDVPVFWLKAAKFYEICKNFAITEHFAATSLFLVGDKFMKKLTPEQKELLFKASYEAALVEREHTKNNEGKIAQEMMDAGVKFTYPDKKPFIEAAKTVQDNFVKERGEEFAEILELIRKEAE